MKLPYFLTKPAITYPLLITSLLALYAPLDWMTSDYWPSSFLNGMAYLFPPIAGYTKKSAFPAITQMCMTLTFMLMPLHAWFTYRVLSTSTKAPWFENLWTIHSIWALTKRVFLVALMSVIWYFAMFINPGYDYRLMPFNSSRTALALGGWLMAGGVQGQLLAWIFCNFMVIAKFFKR